MLKLRSASLAKLCHIPTRDLHFYSVISQSLRTVLATGNQATRSTRHASTVATSSAPAIKKSVARPKITYIDTTTTQNKFIAATTIPAQVSSQKLPSKLKISRELGKPFDEEPFNENMSEQVPPLSSLQYQGNNWTGDVSSNSGKSVKDLKKICHTREILQKFGFPTESQTGKLTKDLSHCGYCGLSKETIDKERKWACKDQRTSHTFRIELPSLYTVAPPGYRMAKQLYGFVALSCGTVELPDGTIALSRIAAVDFFSGKTLIDSSVALPSGTHSTKITEHDTPKTASSDGILDGAAGAKEALFSYINSTTVLIGHSLSRDLEALQLQHPRIIDTSILLSTLLKGGEKVGLKDACKNVARKEIQNHTGGSISEGQDCVENAIASRELVMLYLTNKDEFETRAASLKIGKLRAKKKRAPSKRGNPNIGWPKSMTLWERDQILEWNNVHPWTDDD